MVVIYLTERDYRYLMWLLAQAWSEHTWRRYKQVQDQMTAKAIYSGVDLPIR